MTAPTDRNTAAIRLAVVVSGLLIGFQVSGKATRDALFLSQFPVTALPRMVGAAAILSLIAAVLMSRTLQRLGPGRVVPALLFSSAFLQVGEWALYQAAPRAAAAVVYIHFNALGALMVSAFWSLINERFDPRTAKQAFGWIGTAGTIGGVLGGLMTERAGALLSISAMLPILAAIHFACGILVKRISAVPARGNTVGLRKPSAAAVAAAKAGSGGGFRVLARSRYLKLLAAGLLLGTVSEGLLDYVFKDAAKHAFGHGDTLLRFFALFYTGINLLGGFITMVVGRRSLETFGIARTVSTLPWAVSLGGVAAIAFPGLWTAVAARAAEATMRNSLYRSGFELLFTPIAPEEKRAAKPLLDVGTVRIGDMLAALLVQIAIWAWLAHATSLMLGMAVASAAAGIVLTWRIHKGYVDALEISLLSRATQLDLGDRGFDRRTRMTVSQMPAIADLEAPAVIEEEDPEDQAELESVRVARAIDRLGSDDTGAAAQAELAELAPRHVGQLIDALLDQRTDFVARRRLPAAIAAAKSQRAMDGLLEALRDPRFEVRARVGRALARLADAGGVRVDPARVLSAVLEEVAVDKHVWENQHLVEEDADDPLQLGNALRERASRSLEHVFTVLSLVLPRQPLQIAFHGLHTDDPQLRGTALEYLETALPPAVRERLWPFIGDRPVRPTSERRRDDIAAELMAARSSIMLNLDEIKKLEKG